MAETARLQVGDQTVELPVVVGSEGEKALDIAKLRAETGYIALDPGYGNTGSCQSDITLSTAMRAFCATEAMRSRTWPSTAASSRSPIC